MKKYFNSPLRGSVLKEFNDNWIVGIQDISSFVAEQREFAVGNFGELRVPEERKYILYYIQFFTKDIIMKKLLIFLSIFTFIKMDAQDISLSEQLIHSTVRIECSVKSKNKKGVEVIGSSTGSAFFFRFDFKGKDTINVPVIVTNKHVVANSINGTFFLTKQSADNKPIYGDKINVTLDNFEGRWIPHPDPSIDLCIMPIAPLLNEAQQKKISIFYRTFDESLIPKSKDWESYSALEEILMIGYPIGLWDSKNNLPISRTGQTATPLKIDYQGKPEFLIDIPSFPGSSGSPVILYNESSYSTSDGGLTIGTRLNLTGILYAGPLYNAKGEGEIIIDNLPVDFKTTTGMPINIGIAIKSTKLLDFKPLLKTLAKIK